MFAVVEHVSSGKRLRFPDYASYSEWALKVNRFNDWEVIGGFMYDTFQKSSFGYQGSRSA